MRLGKLLVCGFLLSTTGITAKAATDEPFQPLDISPILAKLKQKVEAGDKDAVATFWAEAAARHTPLTSLTPAIQSALLSPSCIARIRASSPFCSQLNWCIAVAWSISG